MTVRVLPHPDGTITLARHRYGEPETVFWDLDQDESREFRDQVRRIKERGAQ